MKIVSITYSRHPLFRDPLSWLQRVRAYNGLLEALAENNTVTNICRIGYTGEIMVKGVRHIFPDTGNNRLLSALRINRMAAALQPDIVLVQGMIFPAEAILLRWQLGRKVRIIAHNHAETAGVGRLGVLQRWADPGIDAYLFCSGTMGREWLDRGIIRRPEKVRQMMEASSHFSPGDSHAARTRLGIAGDPVFLWAARLNPIKDPLTVLTAFFSYASRHAGARLYMIFHTRDLLPAIEALLDTTPGGREKVILVGEIPHVEMEEWQRAADYVISGSHYEGSGVAVCEAMSCGCIPILTDILSFRMMTGGGACGILYPAGDATTLSAAMEEITGKDRQEERRKTLQQFRKELSFEAMAATFQDIAGSL
jgi:glycosyltransferase involved in cell wall biosynthesis